MPQAREADLLVRNELRDWSATRLEPLTLKGFEAPVTAYDLRGGR